jgi:hypothetical protein
MESAVLVWLGLRPHTRVAVLRAKRGAGTSPRGRRRQRRSANHPVMIATSRSFR